MFNKFIVATDLSPASFGVVNCLAGLRSYGATHCLLLQCLNLQQAASVAFSYTTEPLESFLEAQKEVLELQGFKVKTRVVPGFAKQEINRIAQTEDYALVVVGAHGHSMVGEALLGGVASAVIHGARRPVLVVPLEEIPGRTDVCVKATRCDFSKHILFPTDFSDNADYAFSYVKKLAGAGAKRVTLLHVQDKSRIDPHLQHRLEEFNEIDRGRLEKMKDTLQQNSSVAVETEICYGMPFQEITRRIHGGDVDLVVMGSQGRGFIEEIFLGSVSHNVARHTEAPLLLIPAAHRSTGDSTKR